MKCVEILTPKSGGFTLMFLMYLVRHHIFYGDTLDFTQLSLEKVLVHLSSIRF